MEEKTTQKREGKKRDWVKKEDIPCGCAVLKGTARVDYLVSPHGEVFGHNLKTDKYTRLRPYEAVYPVRTIARYNYEKNGYQKLTLCVFGKLTKFFVHRLVAMFFCENDDPKHKTQVDHIDDNRANNDYRNLEWVTPEENNRRRRVHNGWKPYPKSKTEHNRKHKRRAKEAHWIRKQRMQEVNLFNE